MGLRDVTLGRLTDWCILGRCERCRFKASTICDGDGLINIDKLISDICFEEESPVNSLYYDPEEESNGEK